MRDTRIIVPTDLMVKCRKFAEQYLRELKNPPSASVLRSARLSSHGAETNVDLQTWAKAAECTFCLWAEIDPHEELNWKHPDGGHDAVWINARIDVKHTKHPNGSLSWPFNKADLYPGKKFDIFVLVTGRGSEYAVRGWVTKGMFFDQHKIANADHLLTPGTWYMEQKFLNAMDDLESELAWHADTFDNGEEDYEH